MNKEQIKNEEAFEGKDAELIKLLSRLPKAEPPGDFDIRVRSAIARRKQEPKGSWSWRPAVGIASVAVIAAIWSGTALIDNGPNDLTQGVSVAEVKLPNAPQQSETIALNSPIAPPVENTNSAPMSFIANQTGNVAMAKNDRSAVRNTSGIRPANPKTESDPGGSYDEAVTGANKFQASSPADKKILAFDLLRRAGISGSFSGGGFAVSGTSASGIQSGDIIVAVNGTPISTGASYDENVRLRSVTVRRDGRLMVISLGR